MEASSGRLKLNGNPAFWRNPITVILSAVLLFFLAQLLGAFAAAPLLSYLPSQNIKLLAYITANAAALGALIMLAKTVLGFRLEALGLRGSKLKYIALVVPAAILYFAVSIALTALATQFIPGFDVEQAQEIGFAKGSLNGEAIAAFVSLVILTPLFEEVIFRGVLFKGLRRRLPFIFSAVLTSVIFAVAHGQWNVAIDTFALSLILCYLVEKSSSLVPALLLHGLKNCLAFILLFVVKI